MCIQNCGCDNNESSRCTNANEDPNDLKDQLCALMEGLQTLTRIVTTVDTSSQYCDDVERIEELRSAWKIEDTGFSGLYNACRQMKDTLSITSMEANEALIEVQRTGKIAISAKASRDKIKKKANALQKENSKLRNKNHLLAMELRNQSKQKKLIARSVRNFMNTFMDEHQAETRDSSTLVPTHAPPLPDSSNDNSSEEDWEEISNASSGSSLVTDDGCATVRLAQRKSKEARFARRQGMRWVSGGGSRGGVGSGIIPTKNIMRQKNELDLSFPSKHSGILFCTVSTKSTTKKYSSQALLVCGFSKFDDTLNQQPMFGSRLVFVDGISCKKWKMETLNDYVSSKHGPMQMSFRNELLTKTQIEQLKESSKSISHTN